MKSGTNLNVKRFEALRKEWGRTQCGDFQALREKWDIPLKNISNHYAKSGRDLTEIQ